MKTKIYIESINKYDKCEGLDECMGVRSKVQLLNSWLNYDTAVSMAIMLNRWNCSKYLALFQTSIFNRYFIFWKIFKSASKQTFLINSFNFGFENGYFCAMHISYNKCNKNSNIEIEIVSNLHGFWFQYIWNVKTKNLKLFETIFFFFSFISKNS